MASINFDATGIDTTNHFDAIPAGDYDAMVTDSTMKYTKTGGGQYLELTIEVQSGEHQGKKLWDRLNTENQNPKAVEIANKQLAQLCRATGIMQITDSQQLHNLPILVKVAVKNDLERGMQNEVKGYKARVSTSAAPVFAAPRVNAAAPAFAPIQTTAAPAPLPWARTATA